MGTQYKAMTTEALEDLLRSLGEACSRGSSRGRAATLNELYAIRRELDRRRGEDNPSTEVDFESNYLTD